MSLVYVASKTKHAAMWRAHRHHYTNHGVHIISTWIDEAGEGQTSDFADLWTRCIDEVSRCDFLIAYHEPGDEWKGAYIEIGAALACRHPVYMIGRPAGTWDSHPLVHESSSVKTAIAHYRHRLRRPSLYETRRDMTRPGYDYPDPLSTQIGPQGEDL